MVVVGSWGIVLPSSGGKYKYILSPFEYPHSGDRALIYPAHSNKYYLLLLADDINIGDSIIMVSDKKGNRWGVKGN